MTRLERDFQTLFCKRLEALYPGCHIIKPETGYLQGFPDRLFLHDRFWAAFEFKRERGSARQANQDWYISNLNTMSFAAFVSPDNENEVLNALQQAYGAGW